MSILAAPKPPPVDNTWAAPAMAAVVAIILVIVVFLIVNAVRGGIRNSTDFLLAGRRVGVGQNALAMVGTGIMYSTVIIIAGHVALNGFDAILLLTAFTISTVLAVLVYAAPVRNVGGHTMGDLFALRARERPARIASAVITLVIYTMFMIIALASVAFVAFRMFETGTEPNPLFVGGMTAAVGLIAIAVVYVGGMPAVTRILVFKAALMIAFVAVLSTVVLARYRFNPFALLDDAQANAAPDRRGFELLGPGRLFGEGSTVNSLGQDPWVHLSKLFSIAVGVVGIPFFFMRFFVATSGPAVRRSSGWASMITVAFWQGMIILSLGAVAILGGKNIGVIGAHRDITLPKLVDHLGGRWASGLLGGIALLSVGAIFAALLLSAVTSVTKDLDTARGRKLEPAAELKAVRRNVLVVGSVSLVVGLAMLTQLTHILIPTSIDLAGACVLPAVIYSLYWRRFNTAGLLWIVYGGLATTLFLVLFSNGVSGDPTALFPDADFKFIDFEPGLVVVPLGFLFGLVGTLTSSERNDAAFAEMRVRSLTGAVVPARRGASASGKFDDDRQSPALSEAQ